MPKRPTIAKALLCILVGLAIIVSPLWAINLHYDQIGARDEIIANRNTAIERLKEITPEWKSIIGYTDGMYTGDTYYRTAELRERQRDIQSRNLMFSMFWSLIVAIAAGYYLGQMQSKAAGKD